MLFAVHNLDRKKNANMREQVFEILNDIDEDIDYETETALVDDGLLDSFALVSLVSELNSTFGINITVVDFVPDNFNSLSAITALVERLTNGK